MYQTSGIINKCNRLRDNEFKYWKNEKYVFVNHGFFDIQNFFRPLPLGFFLIIFHIVYPIGCYIIICDPNLWLGWIINFWYGIWGGISICGGAHRLWCHRAYSARLPLRIFLMLGQSMTTQDSIQSWAIQHRIHHKYSDTDADPHSTSRGFFFTHIGWVFRKEHPDVAMKERLYKYTDLENDPVVAIQHKYYYIFLVFMTVILPMSLQIFIAGNSLWIAFMISVLMRNVAVYHDTAFVNSAAHMFGERPYNEHIPPCENYYVAIASLGEGYHNYHHSFPWDYKAAELGSGFNLTTIFIDAMASIGQAYNLRTASDGVIRGAKAKNGVRKAMTLCGQQLIENQAKGVGVEIREEAPIQTVVPPSGEIINEIGTRSY